MTVDMNKTLTMLQAIERNFPPATLLVDTFFPKVVTFMTNEVEMEYKKGTRTMAPFIVPGSKGKGDTRTGSKIAKYAPPIMKPRRAIELGDIEKRGFGENIYSPKSPAQRAADLRATDLRELIDQCTRTQEWMAGQLLTTGACECNGYTDDGKNVVVDTITLSEFENKRTLSGSDTWDNAAATIYDDLGDASHIVRRKAGATPTVAVMSENVVKYMLNNTQLRNYLLIPDRTNLALMSIQPKIVNPSVIRVGYIQSLNLELYAYDGTYADASGTLHSFIPDDYVVLGIPGRGRRLFGAITQMEENAVEPRTYAAAYVPKVTIDVENDVSTLAVSSRCVLVPEFVDDWYSIKVK